MGIDEEMIKKVIGHITAENETDNLWLYQQEMGSQKNLICLFFDHYFRKIEGLSCYHDKSIYVTNRIIKYLETGNNEALQQTYKEYQTNSGDIGGITDLDNICYWCPKTIKNAEEATEILFNYLCMNNNFFQNRIGDANE